MGAGHWPLQGTSVHLLPTIVRVLLYSSSAGARKETMRRETPLLRSSQWVRRKEGDIPRSQHQSSFWLAQR